MVDRPLKARSIVDLLQKAGLLLDVRLTAPEHIFTSFSTDSRRLEPQSLFLAYSGVKFDAHAALSALQVSHPEAGVLIERAESWPDCQNFPFACLVTDTREAWALIASYRHDFPQDHLQLIGVTGTNGKTSTVWYIRQILEAQGLSCMTLGTLGVYLGKEKFPAQHTTPDPDDLFRYLALARDRGCKWVAMEVSSHAVVQKRLGPLRFDAVAFTSFSRDHLDFHPTMEDYFAAKWYFITHFRKPSGIAWLSTALGDWKPANAGALGCRSYGPMEVAHTPDDLSYTIEDMQLSHSDLILRKGNRSWKGRLPFGGDFAIDNFVAAWALVKSVTGLTLDPARWSQIEAVPGRFEPLKAAFAHGLAVVIDYAHTPDALEKTLAKLKDLTTGQLWVVFGCGGDRDKGKRPLMGRIAEQKADRIVLTSDNPRSENPLAIIQDIAGGLTQKEKAQIEVDRHKAIGLALEGAQKGDTILIAGKGHEDYQIIGQQRLDFDDKKVATAWLEKA